VNVLIADYLPNKITIPFIHGSDMRRNEKRVTLVIADIVTLLFAIV